MKKYVLLLLALCTFLSSMGQVELQDGQNLMLIPLKESNLMNSLEGTPYLNEDFVLGKVVMEGKEPLQVFMRYNVHQEQIEIKTDPQGEKVYLLPKNKSTVYELGSKEFVLDEVIHNSKRITGYFINHYEGENFKLLEKPVVKITEAVKAKTGYDKNIPAKIIIDEEFYVIDNEGQVYNVRLNHRDIKKTFGSNDAKSYLSDNKIRSEEDFIAFVAFMDKQ